MTTFSPQIRKIPNLVKVNKGLLFIYICFFVGPGILEPRASYTQTRCLLVEATFPGQKDELREDANQILATPSQWGGWQSNSTADTYMASHRWAQIQSTPPYMVPWAPSGEIPKHWARDELWALLGVPPPSKREKKTMDWRNSTAGNTPTWCNWPRFNPRDLI